jgi:hypothetical protein
LPQETIYITIIIIILITTTTPTTTITTTTTACNCEKTILYRKWRNADYNGETMAAGRYTPSKEGISFSIKSEIKRKLEDQRNVLGFESG